MSGATDYAGLILPDDVEAYDVDILNSNFKEIDKRLSIYLEKNATLNNSSVNCTNSKFTRVRIGKSTGLIIAHIVVLFDKAFDVPDYNNGTTGLGNLVPVGFRPAYNIGLTPASISGNGAGGSVQMAVNTIGDLSIRSAGATFKPVINSQTELNVVWRWDGKLV